MKIKIKGEHILLSTIITLSFLLKLFIIGDMSFSNDEFSAIVRLQADSLKNLINDGIWVDGHPGGVQIFLYYWTKLVPINEFNLRLPFAFFSSLGLLFAFKFTKRISGSLAAILTVITIGFLEFYLKHSIIARPYASGLFLAFFNAWYLVKVIDIKNDTKLITKITNTILLGLAFSLQAYNHYFSGLLAFLMAFSALFMLRKVNIAYVFSSFIIAILLFIPHISITLNHISIGGVGEWLGKPDAYWITDFLFHLMNNSVVVAVSLVAILIFMYARKPKNLNINKWQLHIVLWFFLSYLIAYFYSVNVNPVLVDRSLLFASVFLIIFVFSFSKTDINEKLLPLVFVYFAIIIFSTIKFNSFFTKNHFENFKEIPKTIYKWQKPNTELICHTNSLSYIKYYESKNKNINYSISYLKNEEDLIKLKNIFKNSNKSNLIFAEISNSHPLVFDMIKAEYPNLVKHKSYGELSNIYLFNKNKARKIKSKPIKDFKKDEIKIDSTTEYSRGLNYKITSKDIGKNIKVYSETGYNDVNAKFQIVFQLINENKNNNHFSSSNSKYFSGNIVLDYNYKIKKGDKEIKIFVWNNNSESFILKNISFGIYNGDNFTY